MSRRKGIISSNPMDLYAMISLSEDFIDDSTLALSCKKSSASFFL